MLTVFFRIIRFTGAFCNRVWVFDGTIIHGTNKNVIKQTINTHGKSFSTNVIVSTMDYKKINSKQL